MGFSAEVEEIVRQCPTGRQTMLFSATMTDEVTRLAKLSLKQPLRVAIDDRLDAPRTLTQEVVRLRAGRESSREAVLMSMLARSFPTRTLVFVARKKTAHRLRLLMGLSKMRATELHGNLTQQQRLEALENFTKGKADVMVCTDLAARGLDIPRVKTVCDRSSLALSSLLLWVARLL